MFGYNYIGRKEQKVIFKKQSEIRNFIRRVQEFKMEEHF
jgi:hypothetical protein